MHEMGHGVTRRKDFSDNDSGFIKDIGRTALAFSFHSLWMYERLGESEWGSRVVSERGAAVIILINAEMKCT